MIWVEPCAGSLAVGLRLMGCRSLVGYMGGKSGYAEAILNAFDLTPGQGCDEIWCADTGGWRYCWEALAKPGAALEAADIIDGWERQYGHARPRDVRQCWDDRLAEWRADPTDTSPAGAARWLVLVHGSMMNSGCADSPAHPKADQWSAFPSQTKTATIAGRMPRRLRESRIPAIRVWPDARAIPVTRDAMVMIDPPYSGVRGYGPDDLPRAEVRAIAEAWRTAGARVGICEHERMAWPGWSAVDLSHLSPAAVTRRRKRADEWLTLSEAPPVRPATQLPLWSPA